MVAALRAHPQVVEIGGVLYRCPSFDTDLGDIAFYEPLDWSIKSPPPDHPLPLRMLLENEHSNASYDYHDINLASWPDLGVHGGRNRRRNYCRIQKEAQLVGDTAIFAALNVPLILEDVTLNGSLADKTTIYNYLLNPESYRWINLRTRKSGEADFLVSLRPDMGTAHYVKTRDLHPSVAVWHLLAEFHRGGITHADIWNVSVTAREAYKRAFFTEPSRRRCYYAGENPYPWLHLDGKQS